MPRIELMTTIDAPRERVFDLARSIDLHMESTADTGEQATDGVTHGLIGADEEVAWRARHFGIWWRMRSRITGFDRPRHFRDSMVSGPFARFDHDHHFHEEGPGTRMQEVFDFDSPLGFLGRIADRRIEPHLRRLLIDRNEIIRRVAESKEWQRFLGGGET